MVDPKTLSPGDRVTRWAWIGTSKGGSTDHYDLASFEVVRVNRTTVSVRNGFGDLIRIRFEDIHGKEEWA